MLKKTSLGRKLEREKSYQQKNKPKIIKKIVVVSYISIITLNVNGLNEPTKRHSLSFTCVCILYLPHHSTTSNCI